MTPDWRTRRMLRVSTWSARRRREPTESTRYSVAEVLRPPFELVIQHVAARLAEANGQEPIQCHRAEDRAEPHRTVRVGRGRQQHPEHLTSDALSLPLWMNGDVDQGHCGTLELDTGSGVVQI